MTPDMQPLPDYADSPGNHAAPAPSGEFGPIVRRHTDDLRCELAEAIEVSKAAHDRAATPARQDYQRRAEGRFRAPARNLTIVRRVLT
jgi:hypothetical protein